MTKPVVCHCLDVHYCHAIYNFASFIANYPKQVLLSGIVKDWCLKYLSFVMKYLKYAD